MAKSVDNTVLDGALNVIKTNCTRFVVCETDPVNIGGVAAALICEATGITSGTDFPGTNPSDGTSGRKLLVGPVAGKTTGTNAGATRNATHIALCNGTTTLLYVTTCTTQSVAGGATVTIPQWTIQINDPT
jgi:hypothetical protein